MLSTQMYVQVTKKKTVITIIWKCLTKKIKTILIIIHTAVDIYYFKYNF